MKLSHRIVALVLLITLLNTIANFLITQKQTKALHKQNEQVLVSTLVESLRSALVYDVIDGNRLKVSNLLQSIKKHDSPIAFLYVTNEERSVFAHSFEKQVPQYISVQSNFTRDEGEGLQLEHKFKTKKGLINVYSAVLLPGLEMVLHVGINQSHITENLISTLEEILFSSVLLMLLGLFVAIFLAKKITQPIVELAHQVKRFSLGELVTIDKLQSTDPDLLQLAIAFKKAAYERQQALDIVEESEKSLATTLNSIGDAVISTDIKGRVVQMNPIAEALTGWKLAEAKTQYLNTIFPIINATTREVVESPIDIVLATGETVYLSNHTVLTSKNGLEHHIADSAAPIRNDNGDILGMVLVFNDVSEEYKLREKLRLEQDLLQSLMNDLNSMVGMTDIDGRMSFVNKLPLNISGLKNRM